MDKLLKAKQPDFSDESEALRSKVTALGGVAAVAADMDKMQDVMHQLLCASRATCFACGTFSVK